MIAKSLKVAAALTVAAIAFTGCAANENGSSSDLSGTINGAGSSAAASAQEAWIAAFQTANGSVVVNYDPTGSGAGREAFLSGAVNFAGSDSALKDEEIAKGSTLCVAGTDLFELPVYVSPIAVVFNVEGVTDLNLSPAVLAGIFKGDITKWNDAAIVAENPAASLPDANITAVHRSDDSGTTKNFSDYLSKTAGEVWDGEVSDTFPYNTGEGAKGTSGVIDAVTNGTNTIGYADASKAKDLGTVNLKVGETWQPVDTAAAAKIVEASTRIEGRAASDMAVKINRNSDVAGTYPLVLVSYAIGCTEYQDPAVGKLVNAYISYLVTAEGQNAAASAAGSAPLTDAVRQEAAKIASEIK